MFNLNTPNYITPFLFFLFSFASFFTHTSCVFPLLSFLLFINQLYSHSDHHHHYYSDHHHCSDHHLIITINVPITITVPIDSYRVFHHHCSDHHHQHHSDHHHRSDHYHHFLWLLLIWNKCLFQKEIWFILLRLIMLLNQLIIMWIKLLTFLLIKLHIKCLMKWVSKKIFDNFVICFCNFSY